MTGDEILQDIFLKHMKLYIGFEQLRVWQTLRLPLL